MDKHRLYTLLFNAVDLLLENYDKYQIMDELGMTEEEFEGLGECVDLMERCHGCVHDRGVASEAFCILCARAYDPKFQHKFKDNYKPLNKSTVWREESMKYTVIMKLIGCAFLVAGLSAL